MSRKSIWSTLVMLIIGVSVFAFEMRNTNMHTLWQQALKIDVFWLIIAFLTMLLSFFCEALVLKVLLQGRKDEMKHWWNILRIPWIQALFNAITPFSSGGQPAQLVALTQSGVEIGRGSSVLLLKFIIYQTIVLVNFIVAMIFQFSNVMQHFAGLAVLIVGGFIIHVFTIGLLLMIMFYYRFTRGLVLGFMRCLTFFIRTPKAQTWIDRVANKIDSFYRESLVLKQEKRKVIIASMLTFMQLLFYYLVVYFTLLALHVNHVNMIDVLIMQIMIVMITSIFPVPGGTGGAEYSFKALFSQYISSSSKLVLGMFIWRFITYYLGMLLGIVAIAFKPINERTRRLTSARRKNYK
ncbi:lysylphosphatidylglycerol synthase transmembrane domain-containing protein [Bombilactobacillus thymidiniphilus]|uniref:Phosphatidylglycerol lysyltransferase n=1 Tax=Bombilactobacillus thymidiniphilus TaxID=2923363 RepID=A0ABY4PE53_9LACO|nr:lysylphosphatidylglycerol synthase transmembrane domain-containing protein [Bombilactobacillus thymidiniphilus]UQS84064.1 flippase-like domain-containing protein [Bombilactobacillus thymidiniphilus]